MGKARDTDRIFSSEQTIKNNILEALSSVSSNIQHGQFAISPLPLKKLKKFIPFSGGVLDGPLGDNASIVTIASGKADISIASGKFSRYVIVKAETGTTDTLDNIPAVFAGQDLYLQAFATHTITISNAGNIDPDGGSSFSLTTNKLVYLKWDYINNKWRLISGGGAGAAFPLDYEVDDQGNKGGVTVTHDLSLSTAHKLKFTATGVITLAFSNPPASGTGIDWYVEITQDGTGGHVITWPAAVTPEPVVSTTASTTSLVALHTDDNGTIIRAIILLNATTATPGASKELDNLTTTALNTDIHMNTFDIDQLDRLIFDETAGSSLAAGDVGITSDATSNMNSNVPTGASFFWNINDVDHLTLQRPSADPILQLKSTSTDVPLIRTQQTKGSAPTLGTKIGRWQIFGTDSTGSTVESFAEIYADYEDVSVGSVDGSLHLAVDLASSLTTFLSLNDSNDGKLSIWKNLFHQTGIHQELNSNRIYSTTTANDTFMKGNSADIGFFISDAATAKGTFGATRLILKNDYYLQSQAVEYRNVVADISTPINGTIWYNSTLNKFRGQENGVAVDMIGGGVQTPITSDIDYDGFDIKDISNIEFRDTTGSPGTGNNIYFDSGGMNIRSGATTDSIDFFLGASVQLSLQEDGELVWPQDGHKIVPQSTSFDFVAFSLTDSLKFWTGTSRSNETIKVEDFRTTFFTDQTETLPYTIQIVQNNNTPSATRTIGDIKFIAEDSGSVDTIYAQIAATSQSITSPNEDGLLQFAVASDGPTLRVGFRMEGGSNDANGVLLAFYGETPAVAQQVLSATPTAAEISTVLEALGLTKFT